CIALETLQIGAHVRSSAIAKRAVLLESFVDDVLKLRRNSGIEARSRSRRAIQDGLEDHAGGISGEGLFSGGHLVKNEPQRKEIGAFIEVFAANLLGRHIRNRAHGHAGAGQVSVLSSGVVSSGGIAQGSDALAFREE